MWARIISAVLGLWLMVSPALVTSFSDVASANNRIVGPLVVSFGIIGVWEVMRSVRYGNTLLGIWLLAASLMLGYAEVALLTNLLAALGIIGLSLVRGVHDPSKFGGGWRSLWNNEKWEANQPGVKTEE